MKSFHCLIFLFPVCFLYCIEVPGQQQQLSIKATGTGRTTGHIVNITVTNHGRVPVNISAQTFYIPSDGKYQSYIGRIAWGLTLPAQSTMLVPVIGFCTDPFTEPVPSGHTMSSEKKWVPVAVSGIQQGGSGPFIRIVDRENLDSFTEASIPSIRNSPAYKPRSGSPSGPQVNWPGTGIPLGGSLEPDRDPERIAPLLVSALILVEEAVIRLQKSGLYPTPFSADTAKEREAMTQQSLWIICALIRDKTYEKERFAINVYNQFEQTTGKKADLLPIEQKERLEQGVDAFWIAFTATGVEAKLLTLPGDNSPVEISNAEQGCNGDTTIKITPPYSLGMKIADQWGTPEERAKLVQIVKDSLAVQARVTPDGLHSFYDINRHPTSSTSIWKSGNVGGFASAYAKTYFRRPNGSWEWVWGTEKLETKAEGTMEYSMKYDRDKSCRAMVAGSALIRIRASSSAFDAMAGNTHLDNDTKQLDFLRTTKYFGKIATEWLILKTRGSAKSSFREFVQEDLKDKIKGEITDAVKAEVQALADQHMNSFLAQMGLTMDQILDAAFNLPSLESLLEQVLGFDIPSIGDLTEFIGKGIEASFNLPFVSNTYATANGSLIVKVGEKSGDVLAQTFVHYARASTEETKDALRWDGEDCKEKFVSDAQPDALTIQTTGISNMVAQAKSKFGFGNGQAEAFLESMNLQVLAGICICPPKRRGIDKLTYELDVQGIMDWYTADTIQNKAMTVALKPFLEQIEDQMLQEMDGMNGDQIWNLTTDQFEKMLATKVRDIGNKNKFAWAACKD